MSDQVVCMGCRRQNATKKVIFAGLPGYMCARCFKKRKTWHGKDLQLIKEKELDK